MNGVDYTKQLAKERDIYQDSIQKTKQASDKRVADVEKQTDHVKTKQRENFIEDKAELESSYQKSLSHLKDKTAESIEDNKLKSGDGLSKEREQFTREAKAKSQNFEQRLSDIKSSYKKAFESESDGHKALQDGQKESYKTNTQALVDKTDTALKNNQDKTGKAIFSLNDNSKKEKREMIDKHENDLLASYKDNGEKRALQKDQIIDELNRTKFRHNEDMGKQKEYTQERLNDMRLMSEKRVDNMSADYSGKTEKLAKTQKQDAIKTNKESQNQLRKVQEDANKQIRLAELDRQNVNGSSGDYKDLIDKQQGKKVVEDKMKKMQEELVDTQKKFSEVAEHNRTEFDEAFKRESLSANASLNRKLFDANSNKVVTVAHEREKAEEVIVMNDQSNKLEKEMISGELVQEKGKAKTKIQQLNQNFNASLQSLEDRHKTDVTELTDIANKDKVEFQKQLVERRNNDIAEMKRAFNKVMDRTVLEYENKLGSAQRENDTIKYSMDQKVQNIIELTDKNLQTNAKLATDRRNADIKSYQVLIDQKDNNFKTKFQEMSSGYQRKMDNMQIENDRKMKLLTSEYENKLKLLTSNNSKEAIAKDANHASEVERIKNSYEMEKNNLISQYEGAMDSAKKTHSDQMEQMRNYYKVT